MNRGLGRTPELEASVTGSPGISLVESVATGGSSRDLMSTVDDRSRAGGACLAV